jgi:hypothetical protein
MKTIRQMVKGLTLVVFGLALAAGAAYAQGNPPTGPCLAQDNGTGTVTLPPAGCEYLSPDQVHMIIDGLPPNTTIILKPLHRDFICGQGGGVAGKCITQGGPLGGEVENFNSSATFQLSVSSSDPSNPLAGWTRTVTLPLAVETATAPRQPGAPVQTFQTDMQRIQGSITNDPDFALFEVVGGSANGYPSPGSTTLTKQTNGLFKVDSSFKVGYRIRFIGTTTGRLAGAGGTTEGSVVMTAVQPCPASGCPCQ